jgi:hypothetical protein
MQTFITAQDRSRPCEKGDSAKGGEPPNKRRKRYRAFALPRTHNASNLDKTDSMAGRAVK